MNKLLTFMYDGIRISDEIRYQNQNLLFIIFLKNQFLEDTLKYIVQKIS